MVEKTPALAEAQDSIFQKSDFVPGAVKQCVKQSTTGNIQLVLGICPAPAVEVDVEKTPNNFQNQYEDQNPWDVDVYKHLVQGCYFATHFVRTAFPHLFVGTPSTNNAIALRQQADRVFENPLNHHYEDDTVQFPHMFSVQYPPEYACLNEMEFNTSCQGTSQQAPESSHSIPDEAQCCRNIAQGG